MSELGEDIEGVSANLQNALLKTENVERFLREIAVLAARRVRSGLSCGITLRSDSRPVTVASSDDVAAQVDEVQYRLDDGPCLHAMRDGHIVLIEDTSSNVRWPWWEHEAAAHEIRSCLSLPLSAEDKPIGALNLYARTTSAFGLTEMRRAENFAENASGALALAMRLEAYVALTEQLRSALASRAVIDQALGIVMARERCNQATAFGVMRAASQQSNVKLRDIAAAIVTSVTGEPPQDPVFEDPSNRPARRPEQGRYRSAGRPL